MLTRQMTSVKIETEAHPLEGYVISFDIVGSYQCRFYQLAADNLPITPVSYHPPADNTA